MKIPRVLKVTQYIKIDTLWKRDPTNWRIIDDDYSNPIFDNIIRWTATEKIDGMRMMMMMRGKGEGEDNKQR